MLCLIERSPRATLRGRLGGLPESPASPILARPSLRDKTLDLSSSMRQQTMPSSPSQHPMQNTASPLQRSYLFDKSNFRIGKYQLLINFI